MSKHVSRSARALKDKPDSGLNPKAKAKESTELSEEELEQVVGGRDKVSGGWNVKQNAAAAA